MSGNTVSSLSPDFEKLCEEVISSGQPISFPFKDKKLAIVNVEDLEQLDQLLEQQELEAARASLHEPGEDVTLEDFQKELGLNE
ncbi:MAG: hypothetical protein ACOX5R_04710 [bacterium]|jgi:hypothetical protein